MAKNGVAVGETLLLAGPGGDYGLLTAVPSGAELSVDGDPVDGVPADEIVTCRNELLHVVTRKSLPLTPALFNRVAVPFDYQPDAPAPATWPTRPATAKSR